MFPNERLEVLGGIGSVVEGHLGEELIFRHEVNIIFNQGLQSVDTHVVDNMEVSDIVQEESSLPSQEVTVNSGCSTTLEVPFLAAVVWEIR